MPPGVRPFKPVADSAKVDFVQQLIRSREPKKGLLQTWVTDPAKNVGNMAKGLVNSAVATPIDALDWAGQQVTKYVGGVEPKDTFDPASVGGTNLVGETWRGLNQASNRVAGDIAAIPGVGKPSASPTASDIRRYGVLEGAGRAAVDYGNLAAMAYPAAKAGWQMAKPTLARELAAFNAGNDVGVMRFGKEYPEPKLNLTQAIQGINDPYPTVFVSGSDLDWANKFGREYVQKLIDEAISKYPNAQFVVNPYSLDGDYWVQAWQRKFNEKAAVPYVPSPTTYEPVREALTYKPTAPLSDMTVDEFARQLAMGDATFDRVTFSEPYAPQGTRIYVHRTTPEQAQRLMIEGMQQTHPAYGNNFGRYTDPGGYPSGTIFAVPAGGPEDEAFASAWRDAFGDTGTPVQVTLPRNAKIAEFNADLSQQGLDLPEWNEAGLTADDWDQYETILDRLGVSYADPQGIRRGLAFWGQLNDYDAVILNGEMMILPKG